MYEELVVGDIRTKKGRGQRRSRRNAAGRQLHRDCTTHAGYWVHLHLKASFGMPIRAEEVVQLRALAKQSCLSKVEPKLADCPCVTCSPKELP